MARERRPKEVQKVFDHLNRARREVIKGVERAMDVDSTHGMRPGHIAELRRRLVAVRDEADKFIKEHGGEDDA